VKFVVLALAFLIALPGYLMAQEEEITDQELLNLMKQRDDIKAQMEKAKEAQDLTKYDELKPKWEGLEAKISQRYELIKNSKKEAKRLLDEGSRFRRDKKYAQAQASFQKALTYKDFIDANNIPSIKLMIAFCQEMQKLYPDAVASYQEVIESDPKKPEGYAGKGRCLSNMGKESEAVSYFKKAIEFDPADAKNYFFLASSYEAIGMAAEAEQNYLLATQKDPQYYKAFYQLGVLRFNNKNYDGAIEALKSAVAISTDYYIAFTMLAQVNNTIGNYPHALDAAESAINIKPTYAQAHFEKGVALYKSERYNQAITAFEQCLSDRNWRDSANYHINLIKEKYLKEQTQQ